MRSGLDLMPPSSGPYQLRIGAQSEATYAIQVRKLYMEYERALVITLIRFDVELLLLYVETRAAIEQIRISLSLRASVLSMTFMS